MGDKRGPLNFCEREGMNAATRKRKGGVERRLREETCLQSLS